MVTTVAPAHLEAFDSVDGIAHEKGSIFDGLVPGGVAVFNRALSPAELHQLSALSRERPLSAPPQP